MSRAKSIQLVDGAVTAWDMLSSQDIAAGNFEFEDFIYAMQDAVRVSMYNRIDYSDIYELAKERYKKRRIADRNEKQRERLREQSSRPKAPMPESIRETLKKTLHKVDNVNDKE